MQGNLLGSFTLLNGIILTRHGVICGKAHDHTLVPLYLFILPGWWVPDADSDPGHKPRAGILPPAFTLLNMDTLRNLSTTSVHSRLYEMKELQKFVHLLLVLSIPSSSTEQNHTLALCRLHMKKSLVKRGKKTHHERGKLLEGVLC